MTANVVPFPRAVTPTAQSPDLTSYELLGRIIAARSSGDDWVADHCLVKLVRQLGGAYVLDWTIVEDVRRNAQAADGPYTEVAAYK